MLGKAPHYDEDYLSYMKANWLSSRAAVLVSNGQIDDALADVEEALSLNQNDLLCRTTAASIYRQANQLDKALEVIANTTKQQFSEGAAAFMPPIKYWARDKYR